MTMETTISWSLLVTKAWRRYLGNPQRLELLGAADHVLNIPRHWVQVGDILSTVDWFKGKPTGTIDFPMILSLNMFFFFFRLNKNFNQSIDIKVAVISSDVEALQISSLLTSHCRCDCLHESGLPSIPLGSSPNDQPDHVKLGTSWSYGIAFAGAMLEKSCTYWLLNGGLTIYLLLVEGGPFSIQP